MEIHQGQLRLLIIDNSNTLAGVYVRAGVFIDQFTFFVRHGNEYCTYGPYGGFAGTPHHLVHVDWISSFYGHAGDILDRLGCRGRY